jgi:zinc protease
MAEKAASLPKLDLASLPGPDTIDRKVLPNGIAIQARENFTSPSVVISGYVKGGSLFELPEKAGLTELMVSGLMRGTQTKSFQVIYESIESIGASLRVGAGKHSISFFGKGLAEDLGLLLELLSDVLRNPAFPEDQLARLKAQMLTSLAIRDQNTSARAHLAFNEITYRDHPYCVPTGGYQESIQPLKISEIRKAHKKRIGPQGATIVVVGGVSTKAALKSVEKVFADWINPDHLLNDELPPTSPLEGVVRADIPLEGKIQSDILMGGAGPSRFESDYLAAALGNNILGRFGMMGRIGEQVRVEAGLAYYAMSSMSGGPGPGSWRVVAGVNPVNVDKAIDLIRSELRSFVTKGVTLDELTDNQANFIGSLPLQLESNEGVSGALTHVERYNLGLDYYRNYPSLVASITQDQVLEACSKYLDPDNIAVAVAGP